MNEVNKMAGLPIQQLKEEAEDRVVWKDVVRVVSRLDTCVYAKQGDKKCQCHTPHLLIPKIKNKKFWSTVYYYF